MNEIFYKDEFGCPMTKEFKNFWKYVEGKGLQRKDIISLSGGLKEEFFLRWKHGMSENNTNKEFEDTEISILAQHKDQPLEQIHPYFRDWIKSKRNFASYCHRIKQDIGLVKTEVNQPSWQSV